jgi:hypothetical protein
MAAVDAAVDATVETRSVMFTWLPPDSEDGGSSGAS